MFSKDRVDCPRFLAQIHINLAIKNCDQEVIDLYGLSTNVMDTLFLNDQIFCIFDISVITFLVSYWPT